MATPESHDWKRQTQMLRAECNALRMEKDIAVRMWEEGAQDIQHTLRMAHSMHYSLQTILAGRRKTVQANSNADRIPQGSLGVLERTLHNLQSNSELRLTELKNCNKDESRNAGIEGIIRLVEEETQQWSQLQWILHQLHEQLQCLRISRKFWKDRALRASKHMSALQEAMHQWKQRALLSENKISYLRSEIAHLKNYAMVHSLPSSMNCLGGRMGSQSAEFKPSDDVNGRQKRDKIDRPAPEEDCNGNWKTSEKEGMNIRSSGAMHKYHISDRRAVADEESCGRPSNRPNDCAERLAGKKMNKKKNGDRDKENLMRRSNGKVRSGKGSCGSAGSPLADVSNNISPIRSGFPQPEDGSSELGLP